VEEGVISTEEFEKTIGILFSFKENRKKDSRRKISSQKFSAGSGPHIYGELW